MAANPQTIANEKAPLLRQLPVEFAEGALGYTLWSKQKQILKALAEHEKVAVKSCHGTGKSFVAAAALLWFLLTREDSIVFTTAPTSAQVKNILWREVASHWGRLPDYMQIGEILKTEIQIGPKHYAIGRSTDRPDRIQGIHAEHLMVIADEASGVPDEIHDTIKTFGAGGEYRELLIGNPTSPQGLFYRAFNSDLGYTQMTIAAEETPNFTDEQIPDEVAQQLITPQRADEWRRQHGEDSPWYIARVRGEFPQADEEAVLIPVTWAEGACKRSPDARQGTTTQVGFDVARFGSDRSAAALRIGNELIDIRTLSGKADTNRNADFCEECASELAERAGGPVTVVIDEGGVGAGVLDVLKGRSSDSITYTGVQFGSRAEDAERFVCKRDEMHWHIRELCRTGNNEPDLIVSAEGDAGERWQSQVAATRYQYNSRGKIKLESKSDMRDRNMPSPDEADAVALAFTATDSQPGRILTAGKRDNIDYYG